MLSMVTSCRHMICPAGVRTHGIGQPWSAHYAIACKVATYIVVVTPVQAYVDVSGFMTACFISSCKLLVCLGNCAEDFAR